MSSRNKVKKLNKYKSSIEEQAHDKLGGRWKYEGTTIDYFIHNTYTPDFHRSCSSGRYYVEFIEVKGFFRPGDQKKYLSIRDQCEEMNIFFCFIFANPNKPVRKGAKLTMGQWATNHDIPWWALNEDFRELRNG